MKGPGMLHYNSAPPVSLFLFVFFLVCACGKMGEQSSLHERLFVMDAHSDTIDKSDDFGKYIPGTHMDLDRLKAGGVDCVVFACYINPQWRCLIIFIPSASDIPTGLRLR